MKRLNVLLGVVIVMLLGLSSCKIFAEVEPIIVSYENNSIGIYQNISFFVGSIPLDALDEVEYEWTFGDGHAANGESAIHQYIEPGFYQVILHVIFLNRAAAAGVSPQQEHDHDHGGGDGTEWTFEYEIIVQTPSLELAVDDFNNGLQPRVACPGSHDRPETMSGPNMLFGSKSMQLDASLSGQGELTRTLGEAGLWIGFAGTCTGEFSIRYPDPARNTGDPLDLTRYRILDFPVQYISGSGSVSVTLSDGTNSHQLSRVIDELTGEHIVYPLAPYAQNGVDLTRITGLEIQITGSAPLSFTLGSQNGFGN